MTTPRLVPPPWLWAAQGLRVPWLIAVLTASTAGVALAEAAHIKSAFTLLLLTAPLLPLLCVAASYDGKADPFAEVTRTTPAGGLRILLMRTGQVLGLSVPLLTGAAFVLSPHGSNLAPAGWLLPCLALTLATLVINSYLGSRLAAMITSGGWLLAIAVVAQPILKRLKGGSMKPWEVFIKALPEIAANVIGSGTAVLYGIVATVCAELLVLRRHAFDRPGAR
jgi:hypothetical protein